MPAVLRSVSQAMADRRGRRAGRTASRWSLRTLVVGGIAGAAWLLSAAAAQAAEPETPTDAAPEGGLSVVSLVNDLGTGVVEGSAHAHPTPNQASLLGELLTPAAGVTAAVPLEKILGTGTPTRNATTDPARQPAKDDAPEDAPVLDVVRTLVSGDRDGGQPADLITGAVRELVAPLRLTGGPTGSTDSGAPEALPPDPKPDVAPPRMLGDLTRLVGTAAMPAERPVFTDRGLRNLPDLTPVTPIAGTPIAVTPIAGTPIAGIVVSTPPSRATATTVVTGHRPGSQTARAVGPATTTVAVPLPRVPSEPGYPETLPGAPLPFAPVKGAVGGGPGAPTGGSGLHNDGGSLAVFSAAVMGTMGAAFRPTAPADVVVPRCDAEAPTVSPD